MTSGGWVKVLSRNEATVWRRLERLEEALRALEHRHDELHKTVAGLLRKERRHYGGSR